MLSGTRKLRPTGFCIGVLFKAAQFASLKDEIDLPKTPFSGPVHGIGFATEFHHGRVVNKRLLPYR